MDSLSLGILFPKDPWDERYNYLHLVESCGINVGKYKMHGFLWDFIWVPQKNATILGRNFFLEKRRIHRDVLSLQSTNSSTLGILAHRTSEDERLGCTITETKRIGPVGSMVHHSDRFGEPIGSLGQRGCAFLNKIVAYFSKEPVPRWRLGCFASCDYGDSSFFSFRPGYYQPNMTQPLDRFFV